MKKIGLFFLLAIGQWCHGQVLVNLQLPQVGLHIKPQLWNLALTNAGTQSVQIRIDLTMMDVGNSQQVLSATTGIIMLSPGSRQLQVNDLLPIHYNILNNGYGVTADPNGLLPIGHFVVCYNILQLGNEVFEKAAEECETIEIEPIGPPLLMSPDDGSELQEARPFFTWLPPTLGKVGTNITYDLVLVALANGQSAADAIQQNMPLHLARNISGLTLAYPASAPDLDTGKLYAWQVTAYSNGFFAGKSEIYSFKRSNTASQGTMALSPVYTRLRKGDVLPFTVMKGQLQFVYTHIAADTLVHLAVYDISSQESRKLVMTKDKQPVKRGDNYVALDLLENAQLRNGHLYVVELHNSIAETWALRFMYKRAN